MIYKILMFLPSLLFFLSGDVYAGNAISNASNSGYDVNTMMLNLAKSMPAVQNLITATGYAMGFYFVVHALHRLKLIGQSAGGSQQGMGGPILELCVGIALIWLPTVVDVGLMTVMGSDSILSYSSAGNIWAGVEYGIFVLVQSIGFFALVRGLVLLAESGEANAQHGTVGKGIMYIVGGILAINIKATIQIVGNTFGFSWL